VLKNKVAIITGASSGIGYATALTLSKAGIRVAVGARRTERVQELEKQIIKNKWRNPCSKNRCHKKIRL
jgi:NADP-dependent 3-hydroxy acid dehydrogenase YdfG